ncbi:MAG: hypothetical protein ABF384_12655 [Verrucomicrobiales bacterium]
MIVKEMVHPAKTTSLVLLLSCAALINASVQGGELPQSLNAVIEAHCVECHDDIETKGGLDL